MSRTDERSPAMVPGERYGELRRRLRAAVLEGDGETDRSLRQAVEARAAGLSGRAGSAEVPSELAGFVDTVARHAWRVTREDVEALRSAGHSQEAIFEITVSAALGAASARLERGLAALRGAG